MFKIKHYFTNEVAQNDWADADDTSLRYYLFPGGVLLQTDEAVIPMNWDWIPLLDFAVSLLNISKALQRRDVAHEEFEFTESDAELTLDKDGNEIKISASFERQVLRADSTEFDIAVKKFFKDIVSAIVEHYPDAQSNTAFRRYLDEAEKL